MAGFEDTQDSKIEKAPTLYDSSAIVNGQYVPPVGDRLKTHASVANGEPVMCNHTSRTHLPAIIRVDFHDKGPKNLCQYHWDKVKSDVSSYKPGPLWLPKDPELANAVKGEDVVARQQSRAREAAAKFVVTGEYDPVRGPGNPTERSAGPEFEDHVTPVIDRAATAGGHVTADHDQKLQVAHGALLASIKAGNGDVDSDTYHSLAASGGITDLGERNKYFGHAIAHERTLRGRGAVPGKSEIDTVAEDFNRNQTTEEDVNNKFDNISDLMSNDFAPVSREARAGRTSSSDD
jgi:hypothetical protein